MNVTSLEAIKYDLFPEEEIEDTRHIGVQCPKCKRAYNIIHNDCGEYIDWCGCSSVEMEKIYHCGECALTFSSEDNWVLDTEDVIDILGTNIQEKMELPLEIKQSYNVPFDNFNVYGAHFGAKCYHNADEITLPDETKIYCSAVYDVPDKRINNPDFGLYADYLWEPLGRNEFVNWPDRSVPANKDLALEQITDAYHLAQANQTVEIGCIGAHGRTGTMLACMYLLATEGEKTSEEAIKWVRLKYCDFAIESKIQEWFVNYASHKWFGHELEEEPVLMTKPVVCSLVNHFAMIIRGWDSCEIKGKECETFEDAKSIYHSNVEDIHGPKIKSLISEAKTQAFKFAPKYGGLILPGDEKRFRCTPLEHYVMILKGHNNCIRLPGVCEDWENDLAEFTTKHTISGASFLNLKIEGEVLQVYNEYPNSEEVEQ